MPLQATSGAASYDAFGGGPPFEPVYIESVFSTWLYTGNGSTQTITNGIDLSTKGGLVWIKRRDSSNGNRLNDTARGVETSLSTNNTLGNNTGETTGLTAFSASGFTVGSDPNYNTSAGTYTSWTFRKQAKFFDVVTYTGTGANRTVAHNLGSVPGCIIVKCTSSSGLNWQVYHRSLGATKNIILNLTDAEASNGNIVWNSTAPTSTVFSLGTAAAVNDSGATYVAYLFAHDAGGFGLTGADNVISCGSYTGTGAAGNPITLGYEPQYLLIKPSSMSGGWWVLDNMRPGGLRPDSSAAESTSVGSPTLTVQPTATGFSFVDATLNDSGQTFIYIAIRRGPMKTPTTGTSVFSPTLQAANSTAQTKVYGFVTDSVWALPRNQNGYNNSIWSRLQGPNVFLSTALTSAENTSQTTALIGFDVQDGVRLGADTGSWIQATANWVHYPFRRAPGFFDVVCYTGTGSNTTAYTHNLSVSPELIIAKARSSATNWRVGAQFGATTRIAGNLNTTDSLPSAAYDPGTGTTLWTAAPTATTFTPGLTANQSSTTFVAYLFASCPGVSKVGSYTGTGTTLQIDCGFTGGARFVLIKRTDSTGDWYCWDSSRGIVSGNDPYLLLNSTAAEVTNTDYIDTYSAGFEISSTAPAAINANGGSFVFLAVA